MNGMRLSGVVLSSPEPRELADFQPQDDVRVLLDPDGHPFCLAELGG